MTSAPSPFPLLAPAKINLFLDVLARRADGYHDLRTLFVALDVGDRLSAEYAGVGPDGTGAHSVVVSGPFAADAPADATNLVLKAAAALEAHLGHTLPPTRFLLEKRVPARSGLGGGSSDAATALRALNQLYNLGRTDDTLATVAATVGSDAAFFIRGGAALGTGRGEVLAPINWRLHLAVALVVPHEGVSTREAYAALDPATFGPTTDADAVGRWAAREPGAALPRLHNAFEPVVRARVPDAARLIDHLRDMGAMAAGVTGSGSACFGLFDEFDAAAEAIQQTPCGVRWKAIARPIVSAAPH